MGAIRTRAIPRGVATAVTAAAALALLAGCAAGGRAGDPATSAPPTAVTTESSAPSPTETLVAPSPTLTSTATATAAAASTSVVASGAWDPKGRALDVTGIVPGVIESGGTCTATATRGSATVTASGPAGAAATYTGCSLVLKSDQLVPGSWTVHVAYTSDHSQGTSKDVSVTVG